MSIRPLSADLRSRLRSGVAITNVAQCIEELVLNALDCATTCVAVRVDLQCFKIQVVDSGRGLTPDQLELVGQRYCTSKCHTVEDLENLQCFGYRGEALASLADVCGVLEIQTHPRLSTKTYCKIFKQGIPLPVFESTARRPSIGTTVTVHDFLYNLPVRRKNISEVLDFELVLRKIESIALVHPQVSFSLRNDITGIKCLQTLKTNSSLTVFSQIFGASKAKILMPIQHNSAPFVIQGYVGKEGHINKNLQFIYINNRLLLKSKLHKFINHLFSRSAITRRRSLPSKLSLFPNENLESSPSKLSERYGIYLLNISCPPNEYDICLDPTKTLIEFKDWDAIVKCMKELICNFLQKENLISSQVSEEFQHLSQDLFSEQVISVVEESEEIVSGKFDNARCPCNPSKRYGSCIKINDLPHKLESFMVRRHKKIEQVDLEDCSVSNGVSESTVEQEKAESLIYNNESPSCKDRFEYERKFLRQKKEVPSHPYSLFNSENIDVSNSNDLILDINETSNPEQIVEMMTGCIKKNYLNVQTLCEPSNPLMNIMVKNSDFELQEKEKQKTNSDSQQISLKRPLKSQKLEKTTRLHSYQPITLLKKPMTSSLNKFVSDKYRRSAIRNLQKFTFSAKAAACLNRNVSNCNKHGKAETIINEKKQNSPETKLATNYENTNICVTPPRFILSTKEATASLSLDVSNYDKHGKAETIINENKQNPLGIKLATNYENANTSVTPPRFTLSAKPVASLSLNVSNYNKHSKAETIINENKQNSLDFKLATNNENTNISVTPQRFTLSAKAASHLNVDVTNYDKHGKAETIINENKQHSSAIKLATNNENANISVPPSNSKKCDLMLKSSEKIFMESPEKSNKLLGGNVDHLKDVSTVKVWWEKNNIDRAVEDFLKSYFNNKVLSDSVEQDSEVKKIESAGLEGNLFESEMLEGSDYLSFLKRPFSTNESFFQTINDVILTPSYQEHSLPPKNLEKLEDKCYSSKELIIISPDEVIPRKIFIKDFPLIENVNSVFASTYEDSSLEYSHSFDNSLDLNKFELSNVLTPLRNDTVAKSMMKCKSVPDTRSDLEQYSHIYKLSTFESEVEINKSTDVEKSKQDIDILCGKMLLEEEAAIANPQKSKNINLEMAKSNKSILSAPKFVKEDFNLDQLIENSQQSEKMRFESHKSISTIQEFNEISPELHYQYEFSPSEQKETISSTQPFVIRSDEQINDSINDKDDNLTSLGFELSIRNSEERDSIECTGRSLTLEVNHGNLSNDSVSESTLKRFDPDFPADNLFDLSKNDDESFNHLSLTSEENISETSTHGKSSSGLFRHGFDNQDDLQRLFTEKCQTDHIGDKKNNESSELEGQDKTFANSKCWTSQIDPQTGIKIYIDQITGNSFYFDPSNPLNSEIPPLKSNEMGVTMIDLLSCQFHPETAIPFLQAISDRKKLSSHSEKSSRSSTLTGLWKQHLTDQVSLKWRDPELINTGLEDISTNCVQQLFENWDNPILQPVATEIKNVFKTQQSKKSLQIHRLLYQHKLTKEMIFSSNIQILRQIDNKFIACVIAEENDQVPSLLVLVDQHAAHERVRLEQLMSDNLATNDGLKPRVSSSKVFPSIPLQLSAADIRLMPKFQMEMERIGIYFSLHPTDNETIVLHGVPSCLLEREANERRRGRQSVALPIVKDLIKEHLEVLQQTSGASATLPHILVKLINSQACHGAVKFGDPLNKEECKELIGSLVKCKLPFQCAHGRPSFMPIIDLKLLQTKNVDKISKPRLQLLKVKMQEFKRSKNYSAAIEET